MMVGQASGQKRKEDEEKKELSKKPIPKPTKVEKTTTTAALKEIDTRTTQKVDAGKLIADYLNPDFLKKGLGPSSLPKIFSMGAVPKKGMSIEQAEMRVAHSYVRDNLLGYLPSAIKPSQKEVENAMGAATKLVFDISNASTKKENRKS